MDTVPVELLIQIYKWIPRGQGLGFRAASKKYEAALTSTVFSEIHLHYLPQSFRNLLSISRDPRLSQCVKVIWYNGSVLDETDRAGWENNLRFPETAVVPAAIRELEKTGLIGILDRITEQYTAAVNAWRCDVECSSLYTTEALDAGWQRYSALQEEVRSLKSTRLDYAAVVASFVKFPNLSEVVLVTNGGGTELCDFQSVAFDSSLVSKYALRSHGSEVDSFRQGDGLLVALSVSALPKLCDLYMQDLHWSAFESYCAQQLFDPAPFANLTTLQINITRSSDDVKILDWEPGVIGNERYSTREAALGRTISQSRNLKKLAITFQEQTGSADIFDWSKPLNNFIRIFGETTWPELSELQIGTGIVTEEFLLDLIARHSKSLTSINIFNLCIEGGTKETWMMLFKNIKKLGNRADFCAERVFVNGKSGRDWHWTLNTKNPYPGSSSDKSLGQALGEWFSGNGDSPFEANIENGEVMAVEDEH